MIRELRRFYTQPSFRWRSTRFLFMAVVTTLSMAAIGGCLVVLSSLDPGIAWTSRALPVAFFKNTLAYTSAFPELMFAVLSGALALGIIAHRFAQSTVPVNEISACPGRHSQFKEYSFLAIAISLSAILVWFPRGLHDLPIGSDTLFYISAVQTMEHEGPLWAVSYTDRPFLYLMLYGLQSFLGLSVHEFFEFLPVALAGLTTASTWLFVRSFYREAAGYAAILTSASTWLMRTSIDTYSSFFATFLLLIILSVYMAYRRENRRELRFVAQVLLIILVLSYWFVWVFLFFTLLAADLLSSGKRLAGASRVLLAFLPSIFAMGLFVVVSFANPPPVYWGLGSSFTNYLGRVVTPVGVIAYNDGALGTASLRLLVGEGNALMAVLAALGLALVGVRTYPLKTLYIWSATTLCLTLFSITGTHAALLFPLPLLAGLGLRKIVERA